VSRAIDCEGAPRDLGLDQGRACAETLREAFRRSPPRERWPLPLGAKRARLAHDLERHFPHLAESLAGLSAGARVPERWLLRRLAEEVAAPAEARAVAAAAADGALLAVDCDGPWIARRSRPEGGFVCLALARPWQVAAFAGVNEAGLAVVAAPRRGEPGACAAPASLLAEDCLQRFAKVESAIDWCCGRPAGHAAALLFADARGELAGVEIRGDGRRLLHPEGALLVFADAGAELAKRLHEAAPPTPASLARALAPAAGGAAVVLDPGARRLGLLRGASPDGELDWIPL
jgi:hypothetical protein